jgi:hypothetical protein
LAGFLQRPANLHNAAIFHVNAKPDDRKFRRLRESEHSATHTVEIAVTSLSIHNCPNHRPPPAPVAFSKGGDFSSGAKRDDKKSRRATVEIAVTSLFIHTVCSDSPTSSGVF